MKTKEQLMSEIDEKVTLLEYHENEYDNAKIGSDRVIHARKSNQLSAEIQVLQKQLEVADAKAI